MFGLKDISVDFLAHNIFLILLALLLLVVLAIYLYVKTNPPLPRYLRIILAALRIVAVLVIVLALLKPVIKFSREFTRPPKVSLLLDVSSSMNKIEQKKSREDRLDSLLATGDFNQFKQKVALKSYYFGGNISPVKNKVDREKTALGDVVDQLEKDELIQPSDYWLLLSDGRSNSGRDPKVMAQKLSAPVMTIDMASGGGNFDIGISDINYNSVMFAGKPTEIKVKLNWHQTPNGTYAINLLDSNKIVTKTKFKISQPEGIGEALLKYIPSKPGQKILKVSIPFQTNEENKANNHRSFSVKVLKSRLLVLLVTDKPDYEVGFLKRFFDNSERYQVDLKVNGKKAGNLFGQFPSQQTELNRYDLVIFYDPNPRVFEKNKKIIQSYLSDRGGAVWVMMGEQFGKVGSQAWLNKILPFYSSSTRNAVFTDFHGQPTEGNLFHPAIRLADNQTAIRKVWSELPPFQVLVKCDKIAPDAVILANADLPWQGETKLPILGYKRFGAGKVFASAALPFWKWSFINLGLGEDNSSYGKFINGVSSWLTVSDDLDPIRIVPDKKIYRRGETIRFQGFAFDLGYRPLPDVVGTVKLKDSTGNVIYDTDLNPVGEGKYGATFYNVPSGTYSYVAVFKKGDKILKQNIGNIKVESFSLEEFDQSGDPSNLVALSHFSGGKYFSYKKFYDALRAINTTPVKVKINRELMLWDKYWLLIIFIVALSSEWLLRKINQLI